jgi:DNA-3-methyladenine glycosylase II
VIFGRFRDALGGSVTPESILKLRPERMRKLGLSGQKTTYIRELAKHTKKGTVTFERLPEMADDEVIEHLTQVKGIGVWTAHMFLIFALRRHLAPLHLNASRYLWRSLHTK